MGASWCTQAQVEDELPNIEQYIQDASSQDSYVARKIVEASELAKGYLSKYASFWDTWSAATVPEALRNAVLAICVHFITSRRTRLAPVDLEKTLWERNYERAIEWLTDVKNGTVELDVEWPSDPSDPYAATGHRVRIAGLN
jgi:phage gp36-like protein